jgi:GPI transamidase subunit PIG-U
MIFYGNCMAIVCFVTRYDASSKKLFFHPEDLSLSRFYVMATYALNPLTVTSCVAMTTSVFHNHILAVLLLSILLGE